MNDNFLQQLILLTNNRDPRQFALDEINSHKDVIKNTVPQIDDMLKAAENNDVNSLLNMAGDLFKQNGLSFNNIFSSFMNMRGQR